MPIIEINQGGCLEILRQIPERTINCCVTSPPYFGLRDYGVDGQIGLEQTPDEYVAKLVEVFREVRRVLRDDGTLWLNLGDSFNARLSGQANGIGKSYGKTANKPGHDRPCRAATGVARAAHHTDGLKVKDLIGIPWMVAFALRADGWYLRSDIVWNKPNAMPESVRDRPTRAHEFVFLLTKSDRYHYDHEAVKEPAVSDHKSGNGFKRDARLSYKDENGARGNDEQWDGVGGMRNLRSVWSVATKPFKEAHFATFPTALIEPCIKAGCPVGGVVLDPFFGAGTTELVARDLGRDCIGIELNHEYVAIAQRRLGIAQQEVA
jgi:DNA modification methylase